MSTVKQSTPGRVDWRRVDATTDEDIDRQIAEDPDTAPESNEEDLDEAWIVHPDGTRERFRDRVPRREEHTRGARELSQIRLERMPRGARALRRELPA